MQSIKDDGIIEVNVGQLRLNSVLLVEHGKQVLGGGDEGVLRRWRVDDGREVGKPIRIEGAQIYATALSPDRRWLVCGLRTPNGANETARARVWDARTHGKVLDIHGHTNTVLSVDVSPDSTKFATGTFDGMVFIWRMTTGKRLVGPLQRDGIVVAVQFSPNGDRIATATSAENQANTRSIRIYNSENGQQLLDIPFRICNIVSSPPLTWSADGRQLFAASYSEVKRFDTSSGSLLNTWSVPGGGWTASIVLSRNEKFAVVVAHQSISFWDISRHKQIGTVIQHASTIKSITLSFNDDCIATGEEHGKITLRSLHGILPVSYFTENLLCFSSHPLQLPFMCMSGAAFKSWAQSDFTRVEELLAEDIIQPPNPLHHSRALAYRALVRSRSRQWDRASSDAKESIKIQRSAIGHIANAIAKVGKGEHESAIRAFDLVFCHGLPSENNLLLLVKAIILFECGKHDDATLRVNDLIDIVDDQSLYITVRAYMLHLLGSMSMRRGENERAIELLTRAQEAIPFRQGPDLMLISLIFGWDFDRLAPTVQLHLWKAMYAAGHADVTASLTTVVETLGKEALSSDMIVELDPDLVQKCITTSESIGDAAFESKDQKLAIIQYSTALSLNPINPAGLLVKRSNARAMLGLWEDVLKDADEAIKSDSWSPWGYEKRHAALHALQRYDEALDAFARMHSLVVGSPDPDIRKLGEKYVSPTRCEMAINDVVRDIFRTCPLVLVDVKSGRLCDGQERTHTFKSELEFKELASSMTEELDEERIRRVVEKYFEHVTLSHVWQGNEPSFQDVNLAGLVWKLDSSPLNVKLRRFCEVVRAEGYRWACSDTCCIDKTISTVHNQSLTMMYKRYEASAATFVFLVDVPSPSALGDLLKSIWMTRAWTSQELLAAKVIRFHDREWKPYLGDMRPNHKESPEIMQELAGAIGIARETIIAFNPDILGVREKLRLASTRNATLEEDMAYSLIGIFKSDIIPRYGEGEAALGHLLEEIVARSGEVTVLDWTGKSSAYNSCLPAVISVYSRPPGTAPTIEDAEMGVRVEGLRSSSSHAHAIQFHRMVMRLPPARFANRRLHLPCVIFTVKKLGILDSERGIGCLYRARVSGIGDVELRTSDRLSSAEPRRLVFVHPWIRDLRDPLDSSVWGSTTDDDDNDDSSDSEIEFESAPSSPLEVAPATTTTNEYTRALRLIFRLQQPFHGLLLQQQPNGEFKRVATEHEIMVSGVETGINLAGDVYTEVLEIL